jgi:endonuclease YncB( thermonuclease family)
VRTPTLLFCVTALCWLGSADAADLYSYARVQPDASLRVGNRDVRLDGIYVPFADYRCEAGIRPARCGSRAALALDFLVGSKFVACDRTGRDADRTIVAVCSVDGRDLGAYLLEQGLAVATPDAPFEYHVLERIAQSRGTGVWGFQIDSIRRR